MTYGLLSKRMFFICSFIKGRFQKNYTVTKDQIVSCKGTNKEMKLVSDHVIIFIQSLGLLLYMSLHVNLIAFHFIDLKVNQGQLNDSWNVVSLEP